MVERRAPYLPAVGHALMGAELLELTQLTPGDDVIRSKPRCRDESEVIQGTG